jgi:hypothetical protein
MGAAACRFVPAVMRGDAQDAFPGRGACRNRKIPPSQTLCRRHGAPALPLRWVLRAPP